ncbi:cupin domain-containing protein [Candidatus Zixiibacteriota bacterium]
MLIRKLKDCPEITAGDETVLKELLHPERDYKFSSRYSLAHAVVKPGKSSLKHRLNTDEVYYIISGNGEIHINTEMAEVEAGDAIEIPPNSIQWIENTGSVNLAFLCIVDPPWQPQDEEILE